MASRAKKPRFKRVKVIVNPAAGKPEAVLSTINDVFGPAGIEWDVAVTLKTGDAEAAAREAADGGYDLVASYGGDGTVAEVASGLAAGGPPILLLQGGTGNVLAAELDIPPKLDEALALAVEPSTRIRRVDLGRWGKRWFVLRLVMGFEAAMVRDTTREMKDRYGWLAYALTALRALPDPPSAHYTITVDGTTVECEGITALIANSASVGIPGVRLADDVDVSDGLLDVFVLESGDLPALVGSAADAAQGLEPRLLSHWRGTDIRVETRPAQGVVVDGEVWGTTPVDITVVPGAIGILTPGAPPDQAPRGLPQKPNSGS